MKTKTIFALGLLTAAVLASGCATSRSGLVLDAVGPVPGQVSGQAAPGNAAHGSLVVYSAFEANAGFNNRDPYRQQFSDYKIFTPDGKLLRQVHNDTGDIFQNPVRVTLPDGSYQVSAHANGYGMVTVPVVIQGEQSTVLHLEGGGFWPDRTGFTDSNTSRLPDGRIIGWKANLARSSE